ncbi:MAG: hypothetical protein M1820_009170 [Bogoriella megaspora]|nr:MAG: hypothetical protein M1820_009170 [Bogoriella megaspora]
MAPHLAEVLQRPLYVFDLPEEILATIKLHVSSNAPIPEATHDQSSRQTVEQGRKSEDGQPATSSATSCALCGLSFANLQEQRSHVRSDLHGYNLKQKLRGLKPVSEVDFERLVGDLDESISGSDSDDSDTDEDGDLPNGGKSNDSTLAALLKKQANLSASEADEFPTTKRKRGTGKPPMLWFTSAKIPENTNLGIYRAIFSETEQQNDTILPEIIRRKQLAPAAPPKPAQELEGGGVAIPKAATATPHYFLCMIGGGHFAAMVVSLAPKKGKTHTGIDERSATVLAHKTFHRYTTRRKQGGSQAANDSAKGAAHSAGSSLRRYNEAALTSEVRQLLSDWKELISTSELLFIRATGSTNRRTLFGPYDGQILRQNDPRSRGFPFSTRRATQAELMRSFIELTRVKVSRVDEAALAAAEASKTEDTPKLPKPPTKAAPSEEDKADEEAALHTSQLTALIRRSRVPALLSYLSSNSLPPNYPFYPPSDPKHHHAPTPLHLAASLNQPTIVTALLVKVDADPTLRNHDGKTAFEIAGERGTRDAFRLARSELGEEKWSWDDAGVPPALKKEDIEAREARDKKEKEEQEKKEGDRRKKEVERLREEERRKDEADREKRMGKGRSLVAVAEKEKTAQEKREEEGRGMSEEMRRRLERERRARAAEARMRGPGGGGGG